MGTADLERDLDARVFVIESQGANDHFEDRLEGRGLCEFLRIAQVPYAYKSVIDLDHLELALDMVCASSATYVHFSCHGDHDGISLTDGTFVTWPDFHDLVWHRCNRALQRKVLVFSACLVGGGVEALLDMHSTFCAQIIAPTRKIGWDEGLATFSAFYYRAKGSTSLRSDVEVMNSIVGDDAFARFKGYRPTTRVL